MKIKNIIRFFLIIIMGFTLSNCSNYAIKKDISKKGELNKIPRWYVKYKREDKKWMYETASSVSPDLELAVKKSTLLAKAKLADRINGKMNNQSTIYKEETGLDENNSISSQAEDVIVNFVGDTLVRFYIVDQAEIFFTHHKSYRAYVKVKISMDNVEAIVSEIKSDKKLAQVNKKLNNLKNKVNEVLENID